MSYRVENQRVTALHSELRLVNEENQNEIANMILYFKRDRNELQIKGFRSAFAADFLRTSGKTPGEALFEHAINNFAKTPAGLTISGNLNQMLTQRDVMHYQRQGILEQMEDGTWMVKATAKAKPSERYGTEE